MRYQLNEQIFVIHFDYQSLRMVANKQFQAADFRMPFMFGDKEIPNKVNLECLTVAEHHKVAWDQDPDGKKEYDGYLLTDSEGNLMANQYPTASYGQMSDTANRRFTCHFEEGTDTDVILEVFNRGERQVYEYAELADVIRNMTEGVTKLQVKIDEGSEKHSKENLDHWTSLVFSLKQMLKMIEEAFQAKYPEWTYEVKEVEIFKDKEGKPYMVDRCVFTKKQ